MHPLLRDAGKSLTRVLLGPDGFQWRLSQAGRQIGLTFDDGPDPEYTPPLLDLLARHHLVASFFVIGDKARAHPQIVRRIVADGHALGGHTSSHQVIPGRARSDLAADLGQCRQLLADIGGRDTRLFRPPKGEMDLRSARDVAALGYRIVHWTRTYSDYQRDGLAPLLARMSAAPPQPRDIVLLHDHNPFTIAALAQLIPRWQADGLGFATVAQAR